MSIIVLSSVPKPCTSVSDVQFALCRDTYLGGLPDPFCIKSSIIPSQSAHRHGWRRRRDGYTQVHHRTLALRLTSITLLRTSESLLRWLLRIRGGCTVLSLRRSNRGNPISRGSWRGRTKRRLRRVATISLLVLRRSTVLVGRRGTVRLMLGRTRRRAPLLLLRWMSAVVGSWRTVLIPRLIALGRRLPPLLGRRSAVVVLLTVHGCLCCGCGCEMRWEGKQSCPGEQREYLK